MLLQEVSKTLTPLHSIMYLGEMLFFLKNFLTLHVIYYISATLRKFVDIFMAG